MATINVTNASATTSGAVGDGTTDDTQAIREHIAAANDGDTVYFPEPSDAYLVNVDNPGSTTAQDIFPIDRDGTVTTGDGLALGNVANLEIMGDGQGTIIRVDTNSSTIHKLFAIYTRGGWNDLHFHDIEFDGNRSNMSSENQGINFGTGDADTNTTPTGARFINVRVFDFVRANIKHNDGGGTLFERVTAENAELQHGLATGGEDGAGEITVKYCKLIDNGGYGLDLSGTATVEDTVMARNGQDVGGGTKVTPELRADGFATYRRCRAIDNHSGGFARIGSGSSHDVTFEDCVSEGNRATGFRFADGDVYTIGHILAKGNNTNNDANTQIFAKDSCDITSATLIEAEDGQNGASGSGDSTSGSISIDTYRHFNNGGGGGDFAGAAYTTTTENTDPSGDIAGVPVESEVGAFSATTTTSTVGGLDVNGGALTVRSGGAVGIGAPPAAVTIVEDFEDSSPVDEWTNQFGNGITAVSDGTAYSGSTHANIASGGENYSRTGDGLNAYFTQGETIKFYVRQVNTLGDRGWFRYSYVDNDNSFYVRVNFANGNFRIQIDDAGTVSTVAEDTNVSYSAGTWYEVELTWANDDTHTATLVEDPADTATQLTSINGTQAVGSWTDPGGDIALASDVGSNSVDFDHLHKP